MLGFAPSRTAAKQSGGFFAPPNQQLRWNHTNQNFPHLRRAEYLESFAVALPCFRRRSFLSWIQSFMFFTDFPRCGLCLRARSLYIIMFLF